MDLIPVQKLKLLKMWLKGWFLMTVKLHKSMNIYQIMTCRINIWPKIYDLTNLQLFEWLFYQKLGIHWITFFVKIYYSLDDFQQFSKWLLLIPRI